MSDTINTAENVIPRRRASDWTKPATECNTLTLPQDGGAILSEERRMVCLEATWELEALANALPILVPVHLPCHFVVRGIADRIRRLSSVVMDGLSDEADPLEDLERKVFGPAHREAA